LSHQKVSVKSTIFLHHKNSLLHWTSPSGQSEMKKMSFKYNLCPVFYRSWLWWAWYWSSGCRS